MQNGKISAVLLHLRRILKQKGRGSFLRIERNGKKEKNRFQKVKEKEKLEIGEKSLFCSGPNACRILSALGEGVVKISCRCHVFQIFFQQCDVSMVFKNAIFHSCHGVKAKTMERPVLQARSDCSESVQSVELVNQPINIKTQFAIDVNNARDHQTSLDQMTDLTS